MRRSFRSAGKLDWEWLDGEIAPLYSDKGRPGIKTRFVIGLLLLEHIFAPSDEEDRGFRRVLYRGRIRHRLKRCWPLLCAGL